MADAEDIGKLFVGGLSWETTKENLQSYFSRFGEIVDCVVMKNNETGRSRGFGFVTFKDPNCVNAVLQAKPHDLNGRTIDAKECTPRSMQKRGGNKTPSQSKIFLGGLPRDITESDIRNAMSKFGEVSQVIIMMDSETKKCRGFGFLSFESEDSTDQVCALHYVSINGKQIECKRAQARDNMRRNPAQPQPHMNNQNFYQPPFGSSAMGTPNFQSSNWNQSIAQSSYVEPGSQQTNIPSQSTYDYAHQPMNNMSQPSTPSYSQNFSTFPGAKNSSPAMRGRPYDSNAGYSQEPYGSAKMYDDFSSKVPTKGPSYDNAVPSFPKSQGYHPYRR
ncbi:heterogeneous nuclear ribonucleoprotein 27C-like isoform X2 [Uloborus diversus]|uniref:heterogeneous nuclear ribonucleoprotein 27C-like isoform X2 n=1 Tax=Uloborus diversus TaxID=327109 RepID=UPI00240A5B5D|nr:heterogeneous nuclear ribonucleoprotein 27C-like isoform X2 [Uloborus diversus]